ncbi:MAG: GNAT family N-acetyltransferase [Bdellovibrionales bacterium]
MLRLILPDTRYLASYVAALREGFRIGVRAIPSEEEIQKIEQDPFDHLEGINSQGGFFTPPDGIERKRVPYNDYWLVNETDFIGAISLRYELNDFLEIHGGHIGYGVRPSMMRQGYAKKMLALGLLKMKALCIERVFVTADDDNPASWKAIESNGGFLQDKAPSIFHEGHVRRRYAIDLTKENS